VCTGAPVHHEHTVRERVTSPADENERSNELRGVGRSAHVLSVLRRPAPIVPHLRLPRPRVPHHRACQILPAMSSTDTNRLCQVVTSCDSSICARYSY